TGAFLCQFFLSRTKIHKNTVISTMNQLLISLNYFYIVSRQEETRFHLVSKYQKMIDYLSNKKGINQFKNPPIGNTIHYLLAINCQTFSIGSNFFNVSPLVKGYLTSNFLEINTFMKYFKNAKTKNSKNIHVNNLINL